jgi:long-chain acyl-CoA synthetase
MPFIVRKTITQTFLDRVYASPDGVGFQFKPTHAEMGAVGQWKTLTFKDFHRECRLISFGLMGLGVQKGDRVAILSHPRLEWSLSDMAILGAAGVTVPIYASSTASESCYILDHSEARVAFVENYEQLDKVVRQRAENPTVLPHLEKVVVFEPSAISLAYRQGGGFQDVLTLQALQELGRREESRAPSRFEENLKSAQPGDLITISYTSGTTGTPKGVMITHDNLMSVIEDCISVLGPFVKPEKEVVLSFLPFSHIFGKVESMALYAFGWRCVYAENYARLMHHFAEIQPTLIFAVPRFFEKAYQQILVGVDVGPSVRKKLFAWAFRTGQRYYQSVWSKQVPAVRDRIEYELAKTMVFRKGAQIFGGRLRFAICGGAPLARELGEFFQILGFPILEGYGLTETCAPVAVNTPQDVRFGVVGRPLPEVMIKIAEDGEILVKSRKVFQGYYKMPEHTQDMVQAGWFHTGDVGALDADGFLHITDRKKEMIVTSGGKNIAPQKIENHAKSERLFTQFFVHGDRRNYLTALVTLDREQVLRYAQENQILFSEYAELIKNPRIISLVQRLIDHLNADLASYETVRRFVILPEEFSVQSGELTPSLKVRRAWVNQRYQSELDSMYAEPLRVPVDSG